VSDEGGTNDDRLDSTDMNHVPSRRQDFSNQLERVVEAQNGAPQFTWNGLNPVASGGSGANPTV